MIHRVVRILVPLAALLVAVPAAAQKSSAGAAVSRGKYLVEIMACNDCHTPLKMGANGPEPDMTRMLAGHPEGMTLPLPPPAAGPWVWSGLASNTAFAGPWGISYTANLTPDKNTGLGIWTEEMFLKAMRTGKHMGPSRAIQPPMPWTWIGKATDADLKAMFAYLKSVPSVSNHVPAYSEPKAADSKSPRPAEAPKKPR